MILSDDHRVSIFERLAGSAYLAKSAFLQSRYAYRHLSGILKDQSRNLRHTLDHAARTVPYYKDLFLRLGLSPLDIRTIDDLKFLPIIEPEDLRRNPEAFVSPAKPLQNYLRIQSAGSTGVPRTIYHDKASLLRSAAHGQRARDVWKGLLHHRYGYRLAMIIPMPSSTLELQRFWENHVLLPPRTPTERRFFSLFEPPEKLVPLLNEFRPDVIYSYGSYLDILVHHLAQSGASFHCPRLIITSSSVLSETTRSFLERNLSVPVFNAYQAVEALKIGFECEEHHGIHINTDLYPVRIVDQAGRAVPEGEAGDIIVSNLVNRATVLLNYRIGDTAAYLRGACPCGRTLPLLAWIDGRSDDCLELPSGRIIHPQALCRIFRDEPLVWQYQILQLTPGRIRVELVTLKMGDQPAIRYRVEKKFLDIVGSGVSLEVGFVPSIKPTPGGKRRAVTSYCRSFLNTAAAGPKPS